MKSWLILKSKKVVAGYHNFLFLAKCLVRHLLRQSNVNRWSDPNNYLQFWEERTIMMSTMIPANSKVLEFGPGPKLLLKKHLPEGCTYMHSDIVRQCEDTIVCDLNGKNLPPFPVSDIAVFAGVLEYIYDIRYLVCHLSTMCSRIITSYNIAQSKSISNIVHRRKNDWVNDYSEKEFFRIFLEAGFICEKNISLKNEKIFNFVNSPHIINTDRQK